MKAVITGVVAAAIIAIIGAVVLDTKVQQSSAESFSTTGVRL
jgi:hypothetical protein